MKKIFELEPFFVNIKHYHVILFKKKIKIINQSEIINHNLVYNSIKRNINIMNMNTKIYDSIDP